NNVKANISMEISIPLLNITTSSENCTLYTSQVTKNLRMHHKDFLPNVKERAISGDSPFCWLK
ncbi:MAG TPA: hypothetical protein VFC74_03195, partial [Oscillospiraceae bacterium]|nr:hypothetical protein [Oscillospiraceae bacterium]